MHPLGPKLTVWVFSHHFGALQRPFGFAPHTLPLKLVFRVVSRHFIAAPDPLWKSVSGASYARVYASETISCIVTTNMPNPLFQSKTLVLDGFVPFRCRTRHAAKNSIGVHLKHEFVPRKPFLVWSQRTFSIHNFRSKTHVYNSTSYLKALLQSFWWQLM